MWNVKEGVEGGWRGGLTASHSYSSFVGERFFCIGSRLVMELLPNYSYKCHFYRQICVASMCGWISELLQPVNTVRAQSLITIHLIRMQQTSTVSCDGRTMEGCVRSCSANWVSPANGHLDGG